MYFLCVKMIHNIVYKIFIVFCTVVFLYTFHTFILYMSVTYCTSYCNFDKLQIHVWGTMLWVGRLRVRFPMVSLEFFIELILPAALWPWDQLSL